MRRNLVIVRAGDSSLHPRWLRDPVERSWDLVVSYFGDNPERFREPDCTRIDSKGPKWPALQALLLAQPDLLDRYDYVWLPDDDIDCRTDDINRLFAATRRYHLLLSQPALTPRSYFSHVVTLRNPLARIRFTNFVEVMVPCFDSKFLTRLVPTMDENLSGWGLDFLWPTMVDADPNRIAIIDTVSVTHTRPVGGPNYGFLRKHGGSAKEEMSDLLERHGISNFTIRIDAIEIRSGLRFKGGSLLGRALVRGGYLLTIAQAYALRYANRWDVHGSLQEALRSPVEFKILGPHRPAIEEATNNELVKGSF